MQNLLIGLPSKGRIQKFSKDFFNKSELNIIQDGGDRSYQGYFKNIKNTEIIFLPPVEISRKLANGEIHLGITGLDLVEENTYDDKVDLVKSLYFGKANVVVAVPEYWIDVDVMEDLYDISIDFFPRHNRRLRVATKFPNLTRKFFDKHNIFEYVIVHSFGATEGAPASGYADFIVDVSSTGSTLKANSLKTVNDGIVLKSQVCFFLSQKTQWDSNNIKIAKQIFKKLRIDFKLK